jgi:excinuclease ABC subunit B
MRRAIDETDRRRVIQRAYNEEHGITPQSIISNVDMGLAQILKAEYGEIDEEEIAGVPEFKTQEELDAYIAKLEADMREAAKKFEFEKAARLRDSIRELREKEFLFG